LLTKSNSIVVLSIMARRFNSTSSTMLIIIEILDCNLWHGSKISDTHHKQLPLTHSSPHLRKSVINQKCTHVAFSRKKFFFALSDSLLYI
jgi:hypothetical protein